MWTLRRKILSGYAIAMALAGVVLGTALLNIVRLGDASDDILQENYRSILAAEEMLNAVSTQENAAMRMVIGVERNNVQQFGDAEKNFLLWLERAKANITIAGEPEILARIETGYSEFLFRLAKFRNVSQNRATGATFYRQQLAPQADVVRKACKDLHELNRRTMEESSLRAQNVARAAVWSMIAVGVLVLGGVFVAGVWLANRIVGPVRSLTAATERVAAGDYDVTIAPESQDEVGQLAQKFNVMLTKLRAFHELNLRRIIGEQKKAEVILQTIDDGILVVGADRKVMSLNPTAAHVLAVHAHGVEGRDFSEIVEDEALARVLTETFKTKAVPEPQAGKNIIAVRSPDGRESYFEFTLTPIAPRDGELIGLVILFRNVTALKELDRLKTEFVMTASHELRSPLTSIAMSIELLREQSADKLDESGRQMLDVAHEELERLRALVDELLDLSKIQSGKLEMEFADVSVSDVLDGAVTPFQSQAAKQSLELSCTVNDGLPPVHADPNKMTWVVTNLIGNALRYAKNRIDVSAEKAGPWVHISVRDDGSGIPPKDQARIFEKFVQMRDGGKPGGAGLGLAISREIVKAHHGNIWVESEPGQGTLFTVALPVAKT
jgi:NtrC-family two-component system sensor histidine kinase KinB